MRSKVIRILSGTLLLAGSCLLGCKSAASVPAVSAGSGGDVPEATLPPPRELAVAHPPPQEPVPPAIGTSEAIRQIYGVVPRGLRLLRTRGGVPLLFHDLDGNAQPEAVTLAVPSRRLSEESFRRLADPARLFEEGAQPVTFHLMLFSIREGAFQLLKTLALGDFLAFEDLQAKPLSRAQGMPLIVTASFLTPEGKKIELLVFDDGSGTPRYRRTLAETLSASARLEDIDGDGIQDLILIERAMEEGTGYETFLSWYRWNGRAFREFRTRNVVRNLKLFLSHLQELILAHRVPECLARALEPRELERLRRQGLTPEAILLRTLGLEPVELPGLPAVREIVFPPILENPFTSSDQNGSFFQLSFRIIDAGGNSYIASTRVYMLLNPFGERQFALSPSVD